MAKAGRTAGKGERAVDDRRKLIVQAMHRCIREKGIASTTMTEVALRAGMTLSHVRYYFENKNAILAFYLDELCTEIVDTIAAIPREDPDQWLRALTDFYVGNPRMSPGGLAVMVEIFGVSIHDPTLKRIKIEFDAKVRAHLVAFFEWAGCAPGLTPHAAAEILHAFEAGLKFSAVFQSGFSQKRAGELFLSEARRLSHRDGAGAGKGKR